MGQASSARSRHRRMPVSDSAERHRPQTRGHQEEHQEAALLHLPHHGQQVLPGIPAPPLHGDQPSSAHQFQQPHRRSPHQRTVRALLQRPVSGTGAASATEARAHLGKTSEEGRFPCCLAAFFTVVLATCCDKAARGRKGLFWLTLPERCSQSAVMGDMTADREGVVLRARSRFTHIVSMLRKLSVDRGWSPATKPPDPGTVSGSSSLDSVSKDVMTFPSSTFN